MEKDKTQIDPELRTEGIVCEPHTNPPYYTYAINRIIVNTHTIISKLISEVPRELVSRVHTIYGRSPEASQVIAYILDHPSFLVPTLKYETGIVKATIYPILADLSPWVKMTDKTIDHPGRGPGPRPHVWIRDGEDLVEGVTEARRSYYEVLKSRDPILKRLEGLKPISRQIADILIAKGLKVATKGEIRALNREVPGLDPKDYFKVEKQVYSLLREHREVDS